MVLPTGNTANVDPISLVQQQQQQQLQKLQPLLNNSTTATAASDNNASDTGDKKSSATADGPITLAVEEIYGRKRSYTASSEASKKLKWSWDESDRAIPLLAPFLSMLQATFLPINYPHSVHPWFVLPRSETFLISSAP